MPAPEKRSDEPTPFTLNQAAEAYGMLIGLVSKGLDHVGDRLGPLLCMLSESFDNGIARTGHAKLLQSNKMVINDGTIDLSDRGVSNPSAQTRIRDRLSTRQQEIWDALAHRELTLKQLAIQVDQNIESQEAIRQIIRRINEKGYLIVHTPGHGYHRPDAPAPPTEQGS